MSLLTGPVLIGWENVGVAPPYQNYWVAIRLKPTHGKSEASLLVTDTSIRGWLPGRQRTELSFHVPATLEAGRYEVAVDVVDPRNQRPGVRLANHGRDSDGWYPVSELDIVE
jgi:hypothetical protein